MVLFVGVEVNLKRGFNLFDSDIQSLNESWY